MLSNMALRGGLVRRQERTAGPKARPSRGVLRIRTMQSTKPANKKFRDERPAASIIRATARKELLNSSKRLPDWDEYYAAAWAVEETIDRLSTQEARI